MKKVVVPDITNSDSKKVQVEDMFDKIAPKYDLLNHTLSLNIDKIWRHKVVRIIGKARPTNVLDVATGTCDLAIATARKIKPQSIQGIDLSEEMLNVGRQKVERSGLSEIIRLQKADAENIPFRDNSFDAITVAFGVRNFENIEAGLSEMLRVLKPGGTCAILEFIMPDTFPVKQVYNFYFKKILPSIGRFISKHQSAYTYLPESVDAMPQRTDFTDIMQHCGYKSTRYKVLSLGIAAIYVGVK